MTEGARSALVRAARPDEARPAWYLHRVWSVLSQRHPSERWLNAARRLATPGTLTPAEMAAHKVRFEREYAEIYGAGG